MASAEKGAVFLDDLRKKRLAGEVPTPILDWPPALDLEALAEREPQPPQFILADWLPTGYGTLIAGHGGVGKSGIVLHLGVTTAAGLPFFGIPTVRKRVLYLSCEDRENILHWRLARICRHLGVDLASLRGWLEIVDLVGHDTTLWERDPHTGTTATTAYVNLAERIQAGDIELLVVDGISDTFAGNENARGDVKRFTNSLLRLVPADRGAVLLVGHISKPSASNSATSEGYSGSTAWHNSVRARWYLYPETTQGEEDNRAERTGDLILELQKSNLGPTDQSMRFRWDQEAHMFLGELIGASQFDRKHQDREEQQGILRALAGCATDAIVVPDATQGRRTTLNVLALRPEFPESLRRGTGAKRRFWRHIEQLRQLRHIEEREYERKHRKRGIEIAITTEGKRQCA